MLIPFSLESLIAYCIIVLLAFPLHEFAHAWAAVRLGDQTPALQGRLTLDPRAHIDPIGALILAVGSFGWARPVPFSPSNLRKAPSINAGIVLVSLAGPMMNVLIAIVAALIFRAGENSFLIGNLQLAQILFFIVVINLFLAVFNLIPLAPLDGSKVLWGLMPYAWSRRYEQVQQYSLFILILLILPIAGGQSVLSVLINPPVTALRQLLLGF
ncbi:MAG TPA: site-2 protease family protein [Anaerolineae bacterium]|nr:site-2 protease family protein [Anaerolineae bacterium]